MTGGTGAGAKAGLRGRQRGKVSPERWRRGGAGTEDGGGGGGGCHVKREAPAAAAASAANRKLRLPLRRNS